ncbi:N-acetylmuramoyl-L-alanine amidase [Streptomyces sp. WMMB 714]|nr:N-acetylmuramoyl-L-alanine amidase [Streptomyces sp. WMMB 714]
MAVLLPASFAAWLIMQAADAGAGSGEGEAAPTLLPPPASSEKDSQASDGRPSGDGGEAARPSRPERKPLAGRTVVIDPGHNPRNRDHAAEINRTVGIGTSRKACDTTGTATESGYAEAEFTLDLARRVRNGLEERGATVKLTHDGDRAWGPCVDARAKAGNEADADAAVSLHADGAPARERGFHVILPASVDEGAADTSAIAGPSRVLGRELVAAFRKSTDEEPARYIGDGKGIDTRGDLGGLNLSRVPKVFLECGNMRNAEDAKNLTDGEWRDRAARGVAEGVAEFLEGRPKS